jgi:hypothetical protein
VPSHWQHRRLRALASLLFAGTMLSTPLRAEDPTPAPGAEPPPISASPPSSEGAGTTGGDTTPRTFRPARPFEMDRMPLTVVECRNMAGDAGMKLMDSYHVPAAEEIIIANDRWRSAEKACDEGRLKDAQEIMRGMKLEAKENREAPIPPKKHDPKGCFLTASCCGLVGLADDCFELSTLRRYRDEVLAEMPNGRRDIRFYYVLAPAILDSIRRHGHERELLVVYFTHVLPSAVLAWLGLNRSARWHYRRMMQMLCRRHSPHLEHSLVLAGR